MASAPAERGRRTAYGEAPGCQELTAPGKHTDIPSHGKIFPFWSLQKHDVMECGVSNSIKTRGEDGGSAWTTTPEILSPEVFDARQQTFITAPMCLVHVQLSGLPTSTFLARFTRVTSRRLGTFPSWGLGTWVPWGEMRVKRLQRGLLLISVPLGLCVKSSPGMQRTMIFWERPSGNGGRTLACSALGVPPSERTEAK